MIKSMLCGVAAVAALSASLAGVTGAFASTSQRPSSAPVACSRTEDSLLTDCHGHRLDYRHGGWYVTTHPAASTRKPLPKWLSWRYVSHRVCQEMHVSCKSVEILTPDTAVIITPKGKVFTS